MEKVYQKSRDLQKEAKELLYSRGLHNMFSECGEVLYAGSYALDLLIWKDIDLNIIVEKEQISDISKSLVNVCLENPSIQRIKIFRDLHKKYGDEMPDGDYVGLLVDGWKIDIFILDENEACKTKQKTESVRSKLTEETRKTILEIKEELLLPSGRTPKFSGKFIYEAVLGEKFQTKQEVLVHLSSLGFDKSSKE